jgi:hypothetical protein
MFLGRLYLGKLVIDPVIVCSGYASCCVACFMPVSIDIKLVREPQRPINANIGP